MSKLRDLDRVQIETERHHEAEQLTFKLKTQAMQLHKARMEQE